MTLIKFNRLVTQKLVASTLSIKIFLFELILYTHLIHATKILNAVIVKQFV